jgi:hypothetical protein
MWMSEWVALRLLWLLQGLRLLLELRSEAEKSLHNWDKMCSLWGTRWDWQTLHIEYIKRGGKTCKQDPIGDINTWFVLRKETVEEKAVELRVNITADRVIRRTSFQCVCVCVCVISLSPVVCCRLMRWHVNMSLNLHRILTSMYGKHA